MKILANVPIVEKFFLLFPPPHSLFLVVLLGRRHGNHLVIFAFGQHLQPQVVFVEGQAVSDLTFSEKSKFWAQ